MSSLDLTDVAWSQTAAFLEHATDVEEQSSALKETFHLREPGVGGNVWSLCNSTPRSSLDGGEHEATELETLCKRAPRSP